MRLKLDNYPLWSVEQSWKERGQGLWFGGRGDRDYHLCCVLFAGNSWILSDSWANLETMMKETAWDGNRHEPDGDGQIVQAISGHASERSGRGIPKKDVRIEQKHGSRKRTSTEATRWA